MKGPGERLKYDGRRIWECPACRHRERTGGDRTFQFCACQEQVPPVQRRAMRLVDEGMRRIVPPVELKHEPLEPLPPPTLAEPPPAEATEDGASPRAESPGENEPNGPNEPEIRSPD